MNYNTSAGGVTAAGLGTMSLAFTGANVIWMVLAAFTFLALGLGLIQVGRGRRKIHGSRA